MSYDNLTDEEKAAVDGIRQVCAMKNMRKNLFNLKFDGFAVVRPAQDGGIIVYMYRPESSWKGPTPLVWENRKVYWVWV